MLVAERIPEAGERRRIPREGVHLQGSAGGERMRLLQRLLELPIADFRRSAGVILAKHSIGRLDIADREAACVMAVCGAADSAAANAHPVIVIIETRNSAMRPGKCRADMADSFTRQGACTLPDLRRRAQGAEVLGVARAGSAARMRRES